MLFNKTFVLICPRYATPRCSLTWRRKDAMTETLFRGQRLRVIGGHLSRPRSKLHLFDARWFLPPRPSVITIWWKESCARLHVGSASRNIVCGQPHLKDWTGVAIFCRHSQRKATLGKKNLDVSYIYIYIIVCEIKLTLAWKRDWHQSYLYTSWQLFLTFRRIL